MKGFTLDLLVYAVISISAYISGTTEGTVKWWAGLVNVTAVAIKMKMSPGVPEKNQQEGTNEQETTNRN